MERPVSSFKLRTNALEGCKQLPSGKNGVLIALPSSESNTVLSRTKHLYRCVVITSVASPETNDEVIMGLVSFQPSDDWLRSIVQVFRGPTDYDFMAMEQPQMARPMPIICSSVVGTDCCFIFTFGDDGATDAPCTGGHCYRLVQLL